MPSDDNLPSFSSLSPKQLKRPSHAMESSPELQKAKSGEHHKLSIRKKLGKRGKPRKIKEQATLDTKRDENGRLMWKRIGDDAWVYLYCPVKGCCKKDFDDLISLVQHISHRTQHQEHKDRGQILAKIKVENAVQFCGVTPEQEASGFALEILPMTDDTDSLECRGLETEIDDGEDSSLESDEEPLADGHHRNPDKTAAISSREPSASSSSQDCIPAPAHPYETRGAVAHAESSGHPMTEPVQHNESSCPQDNLDNLDGFSRHSHTAIDPIRAQKKRHCSWHMFASPASPSYVASNVDESR